MTVSGLQAVSPLPEASGLGSSRTGSDLYRESRMAVDQEMVEGEPVLVLGGGMGTPVMRMARSSGPAVSPEGGTWTGSSSGSGPAYIRNR